MTPQDCITPPYVVVIDSREQQPYDFTGLHADAKDGFRPLNVVVQVGTLKTGDYTILAPGRSNDAVAVERKSKADLYGTLSQGRERFVRELERLNALDYAAVVVEAEWSEILHAPPQRSNLHPKSIFRSVLAWQQRYPRVHWWFVAGREMGMVTTFRILDRYYLERSEATSTERTGDDGRD